MRLDAAPANMLDDLGRLGIVGPDHRRPIRRKKLVEQPHLGFEIGVHRRVVVEMVAAEVGEGDGLQRHAFGAMLVKTVRRRLVGDMGDPHALEARHIVEEGDDVGRGQAGLHLVVGQW